MCDRCDELQSIMNGMQSGDVIATAAECLLTDAKNNGFVPSNEMLEQLHIMADHTGCHIGLIAARLITNITEQIDNAAEQHDHIN